MQESSTHGPIVKTVPERLLDGAGISVDCMPMLHVIFERMAAQCSELMRQLSSSPAFFMVESIATERIGDVLDDYENNVVIGVIYVQADQRLLIGLRHDLVFALVEVLFGGDGGEAPATEKRQLSNIELRLARKAVDLFAQALQTSFAAVCDTVFKPNLDAARFCCHSAAHCIWSENAAQTPDAGTRKRIICLDPANVPQLRPSRFGAGLVS